MAQAFDLADRTTKWVPRPCVFYKGGYHAADPVKMWALCSSLYAARLKSSIQHG